MQCREGCGACCIAPSISSPIPGMDNGKGADVRCVQLDQQQRCRIFSSPERPAVCAAFKADALHCGNDRASALIYLQQLEQQTAAD